MCVYVCAFLQSMQYWRGFVEKYSCIISFNILRTGHQLNCEYQLEHIASKMTDKAQADSTALEVHENHDNTEQNAQYLLNSPAYMSSAVRRQLLQEMVKGLPANVQKRINALRNIELDRLHLEAKFYEEVCRKCKTINFI